jgi:hypothetical protein
MQGRFAAIPKEPIIFQKSRAQIEETAGDSVRPFSEKKYIQYNQDT